MPSKNYAADLRAHLRAALDERPRRLELGHLRTKVPQLFDEPARTAVMAAIENADGPDKDGQTVLVDAICSVPVSIEVLERVCLFVAALPPPPPIHEEPEANAEYFLSTMTPEERARPDSLSHILASDFVLRRDAPRRIAAADRAGELIRALRAAEMQLRDLRVSNDAETLATAIEAINRSWLAWHGRERGERGADQAAAMQLIAAVKQAAEELDELKQIAKGIATPGLKAVFPEEWLAAALKPLADAPPAMDGAIDNACEMAHLTFQNVAAEYARRISPVDLKAAIESWVGRGGRRKKGAVGQWEAIAALVEKMTGYKGVAPEALKNSWSLYQSQLPK